MISEQLWELHPPSRPKLHHIGFVVASIKENAESFARSLAATWDGNIVFDPLQKVCLTFLQGANVSDSLIELIEPAKPDSPVSRFLADGGGLHHLCYEVEDLEAHLAFCRTIRTTIIHPPIPAVAFNGRRIAWALTKKRLLLEFLEGQKI